MSPSPSIENGRAESAVGNKSCKELRIIPMRTVQHTHTVIIVRNKNIPSMTY